MGEEGTGAAGGAAGGGGAGGGMGMGNAMMMGGGIAQGIGDYFNPNPYQYAMPYYQRGLNTIKNTYNPWMQNGVNTMHQLNPMLMNLAQNPQQEMNQIGGTFHSSPGYNWAVRQALQSANHAAASGGMAGSPQEQYQIGQDVTGMANQNYYQYVNAAQPYFQSGLHGLEGQQQLGYDASNEYARQYSQELNNMGNIAAMQRQYSNAQNSGLYGSLGELGTAAAMS